MSLTWIPLLGKFEERRNIVVFKGGVVAAKASVDKSLPPSEKMPLIGNLLYNQALLSGRITAEIEFKKISENSSCGIIFHFNPETKAFYSAGLSSQNLFGIQSFDPTRSENNRSINPWFFHQLAGDGTNLKAGKKYKLIVSRLGSRITLNVNGIDVLTTNLILPARLSNVGIWCRSEYDINITNFSVDSSEPKAFVIMQFSSPFNEIHADVIKVVCEEFNLKAIRADETYEPGLILADVIRQIFESELVIAEITPSNPNVYYEVGFAHAIQKPTILLANKIIANELPFDIKPFRALLYENTIAGKKRIMQELRKHIRAILG